MWDIHTMECYLTTQRNDVLVFTTKWFNFGKHYPKKKKKKPISEDRIWYVSIYLKYPEQKVDLGLPKAGGLEGNGKSFLMGTRFWGGSDENVLRLIVVMITQICEHIKTIDLYPLSG